MNNCDLTHKVFNQRQFNTSCSKVTVNSCTFTNCLNQEEGAALFVSTGGSLNIEGTIFSHCSTTSYAGAMSCRISELSMNSTCYYNCSSSLVTNDCFHAAKIYGARSQSMTDVSLCGFALSSDNILHSDVTIGFWDGCVASFNENNLTNNRERREIVVFYSDSTLGEQ